MSLIVRVPQRHTTHHTSSSSMLLVLKRFPLLLICITMRQRRLVSQLKRTEIVLSLRSHLHTATTFSGHNLCVMRIHNDLCHALALVRITHAVLVHCHSHIGLGTEDSERYSLPFFLRQRNETPPFKNIKYLKLKLLHCLRRWRRQHSFSFHFSIASSNAAVMIKIN